MMPKNVMSLEAYKSTGKSFIEVSHHTEQAIIQHVQQHQQAKHQNQQ
jgi:hypothetical protein